MVIKLRSVTPIAIDNGWRWISVHTDIDEEEERDSWNFATKRKPTSGGRHRYRSRQCVCCVHIQYCPAAAADTESISGWWYSSSKCNRAVIYICRVNGGEDQCTNKDWIMIL